MDSVRLQDPDNGDVTDVKEWKEMQKEVIAANKEKAGMAINVNDSDSESSSSGSSGSSGQKC